MRKLSLVIAIAVLYTGTTFAQQGTEKKKTEKKAMTNKHVKKDNKAGGTQPAGK